MSDRSSVIWTTLTVVILETRGSSVNVRPKASGGPAAQTRMQTAHGRVRRTRWRSIAPSSKGTNRLRRDSRPAFRPLSMTFQKEFR